MSEPAPSRPRMFTRSGTLLSAALLGVGFQAHGRAGFLTACVLLLGIHLLRLAQPWRDGVLVRARVIGHEPNSTYSHMLMEIIEIPTSTGAIHLRELVRGQSPSQVGQERTLAHPPGRPELARVIHGNTALLGSALSGGALLALLFLVRDGDAQLLMLLTAALLVVRARRGRTPAPVPAPERPDTLTATWVNGAPVTTLSVHQPTPTFRPAPELPRPRFTLGTLAWFQVGFFAAFISTALLPLSVLWNL